MRKLLVGVLVAAAAAALPAAAGGGVPIRGFAACPDQDLPYRSTADDARFRAAVLCVIGRVRGTQRLNVLRRDARLEAAGQGRSRSRARTGSLGHGGPPNVVIPRRIKAAGYRAQALNEGIGWGEVGTTTPFEVVSGMMVQDDACRQILDPRFRDAGVGLAALDPRRAENGAARLHVTVEYGLKVGARAPSTRTGPSRSCIHALKGGVFTQGDSLADRAGSGPGRLVPRGLAVAQPDGTITRFFACVGTTSCPEPVVARLPNAGVQRTSDLLDIPPGTRFELTVFFSAEDIRRELGAAAPTLELLLPSGTTTERLYELP